jgi:hypothetical protein
MPGAPRQHTRGLPRAAPMGPLRAVMGLQTAPGLEVCRPLPTRAAP